jgi:ribosomal protein S18 acetylase RimI-like enzyme
MQNAFRRFRIRASREGDAGVMPTVEQSAGELFRQIPDLRFIADDDNLSASRYRDLIAGGWCLTAEDEQGSPCGFLCAESQAGALHLCELGVRRDCQRLGIGRKLMEAMIEQAKKHRIDAITLTTFRDIPWNAPFYEKLGFRRVPAENLDVRLQTLLCNEARSGLPAHRRIAMRLVLPLETINNPENPPSLQAVAGR